MQITIREDDWLPYQWQFLTSTHNTTALVTGFGAGKTYVFLRKVLLNHIFSKKKDGKSAGWVIYPSLKMAQELFVDQFKDLLNAVGINHTFNQQHNRFQSALGEIYIHTLENIDAMVGSNLTFAGFDEFDTAPKDKALKAHKKVIGRMRGMENAPIFIVTTPEGFKATYHLFVEKNDDTKRLIKAHSRQNYHNPESFYQAMEREYDPILLKAYMEGEFVNLNSGSVYYAFDRKKHLHKVEINPALPLNICFDFNVYPMSVVWAQHTCHEDIRFLGEWVSQRHSNTQEACQEIKKVLPRNLNVVVYGDAAGRYGSANSNVTNYQIIEDEFRSYFNSLEYKVPQANPYIKDRVNCFNNNLSRGYIRVNPACDNFLADLEQVVWNAKGNELDKADIRRTHITDAGGYYLNYEFPIMRPKINSGSRTI